MCRKTILRTAGIAIFTAMFCITGCGDDEDYGVQPSKVTTFEDRRDGKVYGKVQIGKQVWMAENLRYEADGSECYEQGYGVTTPEQFCEEYGRLYDWTTAMNGEAGSGANPSGVEGVCPAGWHLPSDAEWTELTDFVGENVGTRLKSRDFHGSGGGDYKARDGIDMYGFGALPAGGGSHNDRKTSFSGAGHNTHWWSSTESENYDNAAYIMSIYSIETGVRRNYANKHQSFFSVRCVHD